MSHYLSTFLYEPIARQARRFSSPGNTEALRPSYSFYGRATVEHMVAQEGVDEEDRFTNFTGNHSNRHTSPIPERMLSHATGIVSSELTTEPRGETEHTSTNGRRSSRFRYRSSDGSIDSLLRRLDNDASIGQVGSFAIGFPPRDTSGFDITSDSRLQETRRSRRNTEQEGFGPNPNSYSVITGDAFLPEDDGMGFMRKEIVQIQSMNTSNIEKSRRMHELMTRRYNSSHRQFAAQHYLQGLPPRNLAEQDRPLTPSSGRSLSDNSQSSQLGTSASSVPEQDGLCVVKPEDRNPTYYRVTSSSSQTDCEDGSATQDIQFDQNRPLGCAHYRRNVKLQCSACYRWYTCRFCHDEVEDHSLNRRETKNMLCMLCGCPQAAAEVCKDCGERGGWYYCDVCKLWDDDPEKYIYHCNDCGICRLGKGIGKDLFHCKVCNSSDILDYADTSTLDVLCVSLYCSEGHSSLYRTIY
jgi:uncharacterized CHY-type Zn-finger protein